MAIKKQCYVEAKLENHYLNERDKDDLKKQTEKILYQLILKKFGKKLNGDSLELFKKNYQCYELCKNNQQFLVCKFSYYECFPFGDIAVDLFYNPNSQK